MANALHAAAVIAVCTGVTVFLRALPFVFFGGKRGIPRLVSALGNTLPPAIMAALVVYCLKGVPYGALPDGVKQLIAAAVVVVLHVLKRNTLLSIAGGTVLYMALIRL